MAEDKLFAAGAKDLGIRQDMYDIAPEPGFVHIAKYSDAGEVSHMARQLPNGHWTSKCGASALIEHDLEDLEGDASYGQVESIFKVPQDQWEGIRDAA
jgi:hypothetical protein